MEFLYKHFLKSAGVSTDSRKISAGQIFFALSGPNFDGSKFIGSALKQGALKAVTQNPEYEDQDDVIVVEDTLKTLQQLATHHRHQLKGKIIALTGSNGKTTTKELLAAALSSHFEVSKTEGNFNNHIGVPLSLLQIKDTVQFAIIEMGANQSGDIAELCEIAQPDYGFITNIGLAHLEGFGSIEGVFQTKTELYRHLKSHDKIAFVDNELTDLVEYLKANDISFHAYNQLEKEVRSNDEDSSMIIELSRTEKMYTLKPQLYGRHNVQNYVAACDIAHYFGVPYEKSIPVLSEYRSENMRSQLIKKGSISLFLDAYNANVSSMKASLQHFEGIESETVLVLGDMKELGKHSVGYHQEIIDIIKDKEWKAVILVGPDFMSTESRETYQCFENIELALKGFDFFSLENCNILIKGSRSMKMEKILDQFD